MNDFIAGEESFRDQIIHYILESIENEYYEREDFIERDTLLKLLLKITETHGGLGSAFRG